MQPIKNVINYKDYLSNETTKIFNDISNKIIYEYPVKEITPEYFLFVTLDDKDTMLYKALNGFLSETSIESIYKTVYEHITTNDIITAIKPGRDIPLSSMFRNILGNSFTAMKDCGDKLITSDHILLAMINTMPDIARLFEQVGLTYDILRTESKKLHATLDIVNNVTLPNRGMEIRVINGDPNMDITNVIGNVLGTNKNRKNDAVSTFCTNLNEEAKHGKIDTLVGRTNEIERIANIISRRKCNNTVIVGKSGVGKTHFVQGLAKLLCEQQAPVIIRPYTVYKLNMYAIMSGTNLRGMFEERVNAIFSELKRKKNVILFIDDFHNFSGDKKKEEFDIVGMLGDILSDNSVNVIITTTEKGYKSIFDNNNNLRRQFQRIDMLPTTVDETISILSNAKEYYENFHRIKYTDEAIAACAKLSERYVSERYLPSSAFDILDEAGVIKKRELFEPKELTQKLGRLNNLMIVKEEYIKQDQIEKADEIEKEINTTKLLLNEYNKSLEDNEEVFSVTEKEVYQAISNSTNIPISKLSIDEKQTLINLEENLKKVVVGQNEALKLVSNAIRRNKVGLSPNNRPIFSCMCIGNTGCGKTLMAKTLANEIFGDERNIIRFDMSEYADKTSVNKLIGSSAGYIGYEKGGLLTEAIRNKKYAVLLIDEIEKANDEVYNLFLQILDEGFLTDNSGNKVDFRNTIVILTSNVGVKNASQNKGIGFNINNDTNQKDVIEKELKRKFPPEFINRLDEVVYFNNLTEDNIKDIIRIELGKLISKLTEIGHTLTYDDDVVNYLYDKIKGEKEYGARPVIRIIRKEVEDKITDILINGENENLQFKTRINDNTMCIYI